MQADKSNINFELAVKFVNQTAKHLFLTGKAGTGKTTFLKYIKENTHKKHAIVAPTGIAAMNAGGVTIHSFFQLPFGAFLPVQEYQESHSVGNFFDQQSLLKHLRLRSDKRELIQELELLIIDEVSMLRADLLDAIDIVLRSVRRRKHIPFGGIQMLFIGDLFQLPPVTADKEWDILNQFYTSPFFFNAHALHPTPPVYLELKKIYRQSDEEFISLLNNLRNNKIRNEDLNLLDKYYLPNFKPKPESGYIILTTHNAKADIINQEELDKLPGNQFTFEAATEGDFGKTLPAEKTLILKEGAQIMFIRNDKGETRRYYNGKTGIIDKIEEEKIYVKFPDQEERLLLEKETWRNVKYIYNKEEDRIEEDIKGTFTQYPVRLAWAITIHKSQGLTFDKAIIDAGESFAPGQVYVALSRLTSLKGLVLLSKIKQYSIYTDEQACAFSENAPEEKALDRELEEAKQKYIYESLINTFNWNKLLINLDKFHDSLENRRIPLLKEAQKLGENLKDKVFEQEKTATKFTLQLEKILSDEEKELQDKYIHLHERIKAASEYFKDKIQAELKLPTKEHYKLLESKPKVKKYLKELKYLLRLFEAKQAAIEQVQIITQGLVEGLKTDSLLEKISGRSEGKRAQLPETPKSSDKKPKAIKGETYKITLQKFKDKKSILEIAEERGMAISTIESHLVKLVSTGDIDVLELVEKDKVNEILKVLKSSEELMKASEVKEILGDEFTYKEIQAVIAHYKKMLDYSTI